MSKPLIILDRDGVINFDSDHYIKSEEEWLAIESSLTAIANLTKSGYSVAVATNQSGLARNYFTLETLFAIHQKMLNSVEAKGGQISAIEYCPDHPDQAGPDRKPAPGMLIRLLAKFQANPKQTWFIGDTLTDIDCAINAGCKPALVLTGKGLKTLSSPSFDNTVPVFNDLLSFTKSILD